MTSGSLVPSRIHATVRFPRFSQKRLRTVACWHQEPLEAHRWYLALVFLVVSAFPSHYGLSPVLLPPFDAFDLSEKPGHLSCTVSRILHLTVSLQWRITRLPSPTLPGNWQHLCFENLVRAAVWGAVWRARGVARQRHVSYPARRAQPPTLQPGRGALGRRETGRMEKYLGDRISQARWLIGRVCVSQGSVKNLGLCVR